jgi:DNA ligase 4
VIGRADVGSREKIDFSSRRAPTLLQQAFARAIIQQWEGLVLKGCDQPFVSFDRTNRYQDEKRLYQGPR